MGDPIKFPPQAQRQKLITALHEQYDSNLQVLQDSNPETIRWIEQANEILMRKLEQGLVSERFIEIARPHLMACRALGQELLGEVWNDNNGFHYMAAAVAQFIAHACPQCLLDLKHPDV